MYIKDSIFLVLIFQLTISTLQTLQNQQQLSISQVNTTLGSSVEGLKSQVIAVSSQLTVLDISCNSNINQQNQYYQLISANYVNQYSILSQLQIYLNQLIINTNQSLETEKQARIDGDEYDLRLLDQLKQDSLINTNFLQITNTSLSQIVDNMFANSNQKYATKEEMNRYLCLKQPSHDYVAGICILLCSSGATAQGEVCVCTNLSLTYTGGLCQLLCGSGATVQAGVCVCTNSSLSYSGGICQLICGSGAIVQSGICVCTNSSFIYNNGACQMKCGTGYVVLNGVCVLTTCSSGATFQSGYCQCTNSNLTYIFLVVQFNNNVKINHYFIFCFSLSIALGVIIVENNRELHSIDGSRVISIAYFIMNNILQTY
ncbi:Conserved_hypothetical protein [Hexamita inflata]|uniref:Transmembrane protein n=1 Tax=Hexamita inflata TaxID=28002 RepID=A0AA86UQX1_9EUKA|nr:Conserved hypothetical protein [Hexamita inflata]